MGVGFGGRNTRLEMVSPMVFFINYQSDNPTIDPPTTATLSLDFERMMN